MNSLGESIRAFRRRTGLSLDGLAEKLGVSRQAVWYWETGSREPRSATVAKLKQLGLSLKHEPGSGVDFATIVRTAKERLAGELGISSERIRIVIEG